MSAIKTDSEKAEIQRSEDIDNLAKEIAYCLRKGEGIGVEKCGCYVLILDKKKDFHYCSIHGWRKRMLGGNQ